MKHFSLEQVFVKVGCLFASILVIQIMKFNSNFIYFIYLALLL